MTYRVIALDLDGTLLTKDKKILPESLNALAQARAQGVKVVIVTGRHHITVLPFHHELNLDTPALCCNGTYQYDYHTQQFDYTNPLTKEQAYSVLDLIHENNIEGLVYTQHSMNYQHENEMIQRWHHWIDSLPPAFRPNISRVDNFKQLVKQSDLIWKIVTLAPEKQLLSLGKIIEKELNLECEISFLDQMDIAQTGNSKGKLLEKWVKSQGIEMSNVIAFGDNFNDISMIEMAGLGVAMGNSTNDIKVKADLVTTDHEQSGIAETIRQYVLK